MAFLKSLPKSTPDEGLNFVEDALTGTESQLKLILLKFKEHKLARFSGAILIILYSLVVFTEFFQTQDPGKRLARYAFAPPQKIHLFEKTEEGRVRFKPFVYGYSVEVDRRLARKIFTVDESSKNHLHLFGLAEEQYKLIGFIPMDRRILTAENPEMPFYLFGGDSQGRDLYSRIISGARISLTIGLVGVTLSLFLGIILGGISGYFGGTADMVIQRIIEFLRSVPTIPLWLALSAAIPKKWDPLLVYFMITVLLSIIGWTGLARVVRGRFMALKSEDFIAAARLNGAGNMRLIMVHMVPLFTSHIIASVSLAIPRMILSETALSFLGLGLQPPIVSWGVLLQQAQNLRALAVAPWLLIPGVFVIVSVLAMNFFGDGLRDAADPYS